MTHVPHLVKSLTCLRTECESVFLRSPCACLTNMSRNRCYSVRTGHCDRGFYRIELQLDNSTIELHSSIIAPLFLRRSWACHKNSSTCYWWPRTALVRTPCTSRRSYEARTNASRCGYTVMYIIYTHSTQTVPLELKGRIRHCSK